MQIRRSQHHDAHRIRLWGAIFAFIIAAVGCGADLPAPDETGPSEDQNAGHSDAYDPVFQADDCPFEVYQGEDIQCGYLIVPENRSDPDSLDVELAVAILRSFNPNPAPDPIVYLAGGPGGSALSEIDLWLESPLLHERDIILLDQRGSGHSYPSLNCFEIEELDGLDIVTRQDELDAAQACSDRLKEDGVVLANYNSAASAADVDDLRRALGYGEWNLLGVSYGTRLALTVMRDYPQGVRSVILDSTYPPHVNAYDEEAVNGARAFEVLFNGCAASVPCASAYPELRSVFLDAVANLNSNPTTITVYDTKFDEEYDVDLTGDDLAGALFDALYDATVIPYLPYLIFETGRGNYEPFSDLLVGTLPENDLSADFIEEVGGVGLGDVLANILNDVMDGAEVDLEDSEGAYYSVECHEEIPFNDPTLARSATAAIPEEVREGLLFDVELLFDTCAVWDAGIASRQENQPVYSDIPALVLAGAYDPVTPPEWGRQAAEYLSNSSFHIFPGLGHAVIDGGECPNAIMAAFLDAPFATPDADCISEMGLPGFYIRE